jgi:hypothetical protein
MKLESGASIEAQDIERLPNEFDAFQKYVTRKELPVYIFGADIAGKAVANLLGQSGIAVQGFLDNNRNKCFVDLDGVYVFHADTLVDLSKDSVILIASTYIADIIAQVEGQGHPFRSSSITSMTPIIVALLVAISSAITLAASSLRILSSSLSAIW